MSSIPFLDNLYNGGCAKNTFPFSINGLMYLKKNVNNNVLICAPSTSASAIIITFPYLILVISKSAPIPAPTAIITGFNLSFPYILSALAFSTFNILPQSGNIA